ncbi:branched-chain amino acid transporter permease [Bifidobacterium thermacidophilum]|uniref:Branched-chain amino acid transport protein AzlD n=1 Tax=Bifidobacterium thermacidophilum subsp. thermacidophilum TaxID=79262 RepID=A0A087E199_9BIFI|nr:AzlD domain-containing protein [Bifidobacterium thermacidophilum]KFJ01550.1 branched-chain amino acid transport protein AzlD [Bifidobacterium thermacidophilum subsp. thermacidophilum]
MTWQQQLITILVVILGTVTTRFTPYLVFSENRPIPPVVKYLGKVLAPAVFGLLIVYCLRNVSVISGSHGLPELISLLVVTGLYAWRRDMLTPMVGGTLCYMVLIHLL